MRCDQPILYKIQARENRTDLDFTDKLKMYKRIMSLDNKFIEETIMKYN